MTRPADTSLRTTFDEDAELYDRVRPGYPPEMFDDLAEFAGIGPDCRILEVGAGTGKATLALAQRGCRVVAVELGANMAAVAARNLVAFNDVNVVVSAFETWPLPVEPFDVVIAATAFHWLDPTIRARKAADALRPGGVLAIVQTNHIAGGTSDFFTEVQGCYERWNPAATTQGLRLPTSDQVPTDVADVDDCGRFAPATQRRYEWDLTYTRTQYLDLLMSYSNHRAMPEAPRVGLLDCIGRLIDNTYRGAITKRYLTQLFLYRRTT